MSKARKAKKPTNWREEIKGIVLILVGIFLLHSLVAKPFFIPSESMMPDLLVGDQLLVTKYPYGWSWVSPSFHILPPIKGRLFGRMPQRGDIVVFTPPGGTQDWIKRVVGLPGDTIAMKDGQPIINGVPVPQQVEPQLDLPVDANNPCSPRELPGALDRGPDGRLHCLVNVVRETLPNGVTYKIIDAFQSPFDDMAPVKVPPGQLFLMGDNRDNSADSRVPRIDGGLGGPVPWENIGGRAEFISLSFNGTTTLNPLTWWPAVRQDRSFTSLRPRRVPQQRSAP